jgi:3-oxoacyl-[acyl-carrier protein] reductase
MAQRVAVITGAAMGLGWGIAQCLARDGFDCVMLDKTEDVHARADELVGRGLKASGLVVELTDSAALPGVAAGILRDKGRCDVLVNNAGRHSKRKDGQRFAFEEVPLDIWQYEIALHMTAPFLLAQAFLPGMRERGWGRVINVASRAGRTYTVQAGAQYHSSKSGEIGLTRAIAGEYAPFGITCNCVAPGRFKTPLTDTSAADAKAIALTELRVGRLGDPMEMGETVSFLASEGSAFITGAVIDVNGGGFFAP